MHLDRRPLCGLTARGSVCPGCLGAAQTARAKRMSHGPRTRLRSTPAPANA